MDLLQEPMLRLRVVLWPGRGLVSIDKRRLWCFKEHLLVGHLLVGHSEDAPIVLVFFLRLLR